MPSRNFYRVHPQDAPSPGCGDHPEDQLSPGCAAHPRMYLSQDGRRHPQDTPIPGCVRSSPDGPPYLQMPAGPHLSISATHAAVDFDMAGGVWRLAARLPSVSRRLAEGVQSAVPSSSRIFTPKSADSHLAVADARRATRNESRARRADRDRHRPRSRLGSDQREPQVARRLDLRDRGRGPGERAAGRAHLYAAPQPCHKPPCV